MSRRFDLPRAAEELSLDELDAVSGGRSQNVFPPESTWGFPSYSNSGHRYAVISDPFPQGTTRDEANAIVNRYNAPTYDGLWGKGNDPSATSGWVAEPLTGLPIGSVSMDRGTNEDGGAWVRNTTDPLHPFNGTITRSIVESPEGFRVLTEGQGEGAGAIPLLGNTRNYINSHGLGPIPGGPEIFARLDDNMMANAPRIQNELFAQQDQANRDQGYYGAFGEPPTGSGPGNMDPQLQDFAQQDQANRDQGYYGAFGEPPTGTGEHGYSGQNEMESANDAYSGGYSGNNEMESANDAYSGGGYSGQNEMESANDAYSGGGGGDVSGGGYSGQNEMESANDAYSGGGGGDVSGGGYSGQNEMESANDAYSGGGGGDVSGGGYSGQNEMESTNDAYSGGGDSSSGGDSFGGGGDDFGGAY